MFAKSHTKKQEKSLQSTGLVLLDEARSQLIEEIDIMCQLDHPNVILLEEIYESDNIVVYLVQERCPGGELFDQLDKQKDYHFSEDKVRELVKQILSAVSYLHSQGIVYRDLELFIEILNWRTFCLQQRIPILNWK